MEWGQVFEQIKPVVGGFGALALVVVLWFYQQRNSRAMEDANTGANISAIRHWQEVAENLEKTATSAIAENRALLQQRTDQAVLIAQLQARVDVLNTTLETQIQLIATQTQTIEALRREVAGLRGATHAT